MKVRVLAGRPAGFGESEVDVKTSVVCGSRARSPDTPTIPANGGGTLGGMTAVAAEVSAREELHERIDALSDDECERLLDMVWLHFEDYVLTPAEEEAVAEGRAAIERGDFITGEEFRKKYGL